MSPFRQSIAILSFVVALCVPSTRAAAAPIQPFDAVVQPANGEDVFARSGPGQERHYPTMKLPAGERVHVLRKDPGGWYMIAPPAGSYSWILARYVQRNGQQGTVTENSVIVRVGAAGSAQRDVEQVRLSKGDVVEVIGQETLDSDKGRDLWLKIKPPRGEYRWVKGSHLVELNPDGTPKVLQKTTVRKPTKQVDEPGDTVAVAVPTKPLGNSKSPAIMRDPGTAGEDAPLYGHAPGRKPAGTDPFSDSEPADGQSEEVAIREDLQLLDQELRDILKKPVTEWNLGNQLEDLQALKDMTEDESLAADIDRRLVKVQNYQKAHEDAVYLAQRLRPTSPAPGVPPGSTVHRVPGQDSSNITRASMRFEGAGIIHRLPNPPPGAPRYVIAAPDRRILCYLESEPGIDLEKYLGQSMGLNGPRSYDPRLRADRMRVQKATPVRLSK